MLRAVVLEMIKFIVLLLFCLASAESRILSRKRRYLSFPEGSTLTVAICMTSQMGITPGQIFTEGVNWAINYELPNSTKSFKDFKKPMAEMRRRSRRDLYEKFSTLIQSAGYNGEACILRSLCEAASKLGPRSETLLDEILNIVFRFPQQKLLSGEPDEHRRYHWASRIGKYGNDGDCGDKFPDCPFSLIDMALGYYSAEGFV